jgi:acylpyruvate hydrolase
MRLATFEVDDTRRLGAIVGERVIDLSAAAADLAPRTSGLADVPADMLALLRAGDEGMEAVRALLNAVETAGTTDQYSHSLSAVRLRAPLRTPSKILCIGQNYRDHVIEQNATMPDKPVMFAKFTTTIIGPGDAIVYPTTTKELDYEAELVVVIGKTGKHITRDAAYEYVAGYMVGQDVTARDLQRGDGQWVRAKSQDTFAPLGPYLTTRDEVPDPQSLTIKLWVNGEVRQDSNTSNLIFDVPYLIEFISQGITLCPGDLIYTGTPPGVGAFRKPEPALLQVGDQVTVEIERLGSLSNHVMADPHGA